MSQAFGWVVLAGVFAVELLAMAAAAVWGASYAGAWLAVVAALAVAVVWGLFASPKAPWAPGLVRPVTKVLVFGLAATGLWLSGHEALAVGFAVVVVVVHALASLPLVRALTAEH